MTTTMDLYGPLQAYRDAQFKAHCEYILETYLDPWINFFICSHRPIKG